MKKYKQFILGFLIGSILFSLTTVFADNSIIQVIMSDIKVTIEGKLVELKDVNGNKIKPLLYNGTTYLPVRAIAEILDKEVQWDNGTNTIKITGKKETGGDALQEIQYIKEGNLNITVYEGKKYVTPVSITKELNIDYNMQIIADKVNRDNSTVNFFHRSTKGNPFVENYPVLLLNISSESFAIPYDDYKNDLLPKLLQIKDEQN